MSTAITLSQMADLALGTPEVGAVNFNVLHSLLHAMIQKLGIADIKSEIPKSDKEFLTRRRDDPDAFSTAGTDISDRDSAITGITDDSGIGGRSAEKSSGRSPYHQLEDKVAKLEKQFNELNNLPTNQTLYERTKSKGEGERPTPVSDMWQAMQLKNRVDANESGISKLMSLVQDLMGDMQSLKDDVQSLKDENKEIRKQLADVKDMEELLKRLKALEDFTNEMNEKFSQLPGPEMFNDYVSWAALEDALKGLRDGLDELSNREPPAPPAPPQRVVIEMASQTTPRSRPGSSRPHSGKSTPGPSEELQALLEKLGRLTDRHDKLEVRVDDIEEELKNKLDKSALEGLNLGVPDDLLQKLKNIQEEIERLKKTVGRMDALEAVVTELQAFEQSDISPLPPVSTTPELSTVPEGSELVTPPDVAVVTPAQEETTRTPDMPGEEPARSGVVREEGAMRPASAPSPSPGLITVASARRCLSPAPSDQQEQGGPQDVGTSPSVTMVTTGSALLPVVSRRSVRDDTFKAFVDKVEKVTDDLEGRAKSLAEKHKDLKRVVTCEVSRLDDDISSLRELLEDYPPGYRASSPPPDYGGDPVLHDLQQMVTKNSSLLEKQRNKLRNITQETNREIGDSKERIRELDEALRGLAERLSSMSGTVSHDNHTDSVAAPQHEDTQSKRVNPPVIGVEPEASTPAPSIDLAAVPATRGGDNEAFQRMQMNIANLQSQLERLDKITQNLIDKNTEQQNSIDELYKQCAQLEENKADKEFVQTEVEVKADKRLVDGKVNRSLFDSTCDDLNKMINDILNKLAASDEDWKKLLAQLNDDLDGKLDRLEFGPIKDELEKQLRALAKRLKDMNRDFDNFEDDAAGIRKQLIQRFHCISCDRPVDMIPQGPVPSIPAPNALPATRSARPYTTFELEQIRQHAKSMGSFPEKIQLMYPSGLTTTARELVALDGKKKMSNFERAILENRIARSHMHDLRAYLVHFGKDFAKFNLKGAPLQPVSQPPVEVMDAYQTSRSCGGSHTLTYPHRRTQRTAHLNEFQTGLVMQPSTDRMWATTSNLFRDDTEVTIIPPHKGEVDIQGADGHIYRGRQGRQLPNVNQGSMTGKNHPMLPKRAQTSLGEKGPSPPAMSPRPTSARLSRPTSRPQSAQALTEVTIPREGVSSPPPAPAPSEPDAHSVNGQ